MSDTLLSIGYGLIAGTIAVLMVPSKFSMGTFLVMILTLGVTMVVLLILKAILR